jgi:hypothetical protein
METSKPPRLSRDLQRHLGKQLGKMGERLLQEPLPQRMQSLLDHLRSEDRDDDYTGAGSERRMSYSN